MLCATSLPVLATASLLLSASLISAGPTPPHSFKRSGAHQTKGRRAPAEPIKRSSWVLSQAAEGDSFFNDWNFFTGADPTHGTVKYVDQATATDQHLIAINPQKHAIMAVDWPNEQTSYGRQAVRISSRWSFNVGSLLVLDAVHVPTGCGTWPAFWTLGDKAWPAGGEIDIMEGVNNFAVNQASIHTSPGCTLPSNQLASTSQLTEGWFVNTDCASAHTNNEGCGARAPLSNTASYGEGFNAVGGGVYAMTLDNDGVTVWHWQRNQIPADIHSNSPDPASWGTPQARFVSDKCNPSDFFTNMNALFSNTFCGDWAGGMWNQALGAAGETESCAAKTGYASCADYVKNVGHAFEQAYWEVASVKLYQKA